MASQAGRSFGPYEVLEPIGSGGMGEVFKARDSRLNRIVAIKTSKDQFSDRFAGEARAAAALNHPHIATIYDVGPDFLVMEFVEGEPLRGPLPEARALQLARQILEALEAAHRRGIVHRDLKPANILVGKAGIKLLDFGLAQMKEIAPGGDGTATMALSAEGSIAGTLQYMAPEQLQGKPADARSDIFSFGLVLYELLTGKPAFQADNPASMIAAIMSTDAPSLHDRVPSATPAVDRIVHLCLAKDPDERWQSAGDIRRAIDLAGLAPATVPVVASDARKLKWWYAALPVVLLGAVIAWVALGGAASRSFDPWTFRPLTYSGRAYGPAISPDGKQVAFRWTGEHDNEFDLYVQLVSGGNPLRLKGTQPFGRPSWSPDSSQIAYQTRDGLYVIPGLGGTPRRVAGFKGFHSMTNVAWSPGGSYFVIDGRRTGLLTIPSEGGDPRQLTNPQGASDTVPAISPDGSAVAFVRRTSTFNSSLMLLSLTKEGTASGEPKAIGESEWLINSLDWMSDGKEIIFESSRGGGNAALWRVSRDGGEPVRVNVPSMVAGDPAIGGGAGRMVFVSGYYETKIFKLPIANGKPGTPQPIVEALGDHRDLGVSPDGSRIVFVGTRTGSKEIWIASADGSRQTQLTFFNGASVGSPRWSPDGTQIVFDGYASGSSDLYVVSAEGGKPVRLTTEPANEVRPSWSRDSKWIYFGWDREGKQEIWKIPAGGGTPVQVTKSGGIEAFESPDGQWLYVVDTPRLYRMRIDGSQETELMSGVYPSRFYVGDKNIYVIDEIGSTLLRASAASPVFERFVAFDSASQPNCLGACIALPWDESYAVYRRNTRTMTSLTLIESFR